MSTPPLTNLACSSSGAAVLFATDEWFATAENLLSPGECPYLDRARSPLVLSCTPALTSSSSVHRHARTRSDPPVFVPDLYCEQGKVMDGWETRRKRSAGHDWCVIRLGGVGAGPCEVRRIELDTAHFTGNQAPRVSVEGVRVVPPPGRDGAGRGDDHMYDWMPGAATRLARGAGGRGVRGTGRRPAEVEAAEAACRDVARRIAPGGDGRWMELLPATPLGPGYEDTRRHSFDLTGAALDGITRMGGVTHVRLNYFPDGGVARLRVIGRPLAGAAPSGGAAPARPSGACAVVHPHSSRSDPPSSRPHVHPELSSSAAGGAGVGCSNRHYGVPSNLLAPGPGRDMGDGWETARHPDRPAVVVKDERGLQDTDLMDWAVLRLGSGGTDGGGPSRVILDTRHFRGNFPESAAVDGCCADGLGDDEVIASAGGKGGTGTVEWFPLVERTPLSADAEHVFDAGGMPRGGRRRTTHVRVSIYPDGGLSRVRVYGAPAGGGGGAGFPLSHL